MKKVLIVDNSSYMRSLIKKVIEQGGFNTTVEASSREEAIEVFKDQNPEIVILDLNMSEFTMEGIDVLRDIMEINSQTAVIIISAVGHQSVQDECIGLGAKGYLRKPFETETLLNVLEGLK